VVIKPEAIAEFGGDRAGGAFADVTEVAADPPGAVTRTASRGAAEVR
jgi:hypothetical protein